MNEETIRAMLKDVIEEVDYDIAKDYDIATAEDTEQAIENMNDLVAIAKKYINNTIE